MACGGTGAEVVIAYLCLAQSHSYAQRFHNIENNLGDAQESAKKNFLKKVLMEEKLLSFIGTK